MAALTLMKNKPNTYHSEMALYVTPHDQGKATFHVCSGLFAYSASIRFSWKSQSPHGGVKPDAEGSTEGSGFSKGVFWEVSLYLEERAGKKSHAARAPSSPRQQRALQLHERQDTLPSWPDWKNELQTGRAPLFPPRNSTENIFHSLRMVSTLKISKRSLGEGKLRGPPDSRLPQGLPTPPTPLTFQGELKMSVAGIVKEQPIPPTVHKPETSFT